MKKSKTEKLLRRVVKDDQKRLMYTTAELTYMELQLNLMKLSRKKKQLARRAQKGFTPTCKTGKKQHQQQESSAIQSEQKLEES